MKDIVRPMFPHAVDSTMLASFRSCPQKFFRQYLQHWKPKGESVHLVAGGAFAKGIEAARKTFFEGQVSQPFWLHPETKERSESLIHGVKASWEDIDCESGNRTLAEEYGIGALMAAYGEFECPPTSGKSLERTAGALEFYFEQYPLGADGMLPVTFPNGRRGIEVSFAEPLPFEHPVSGDPILFTGRADMLAEFAGGVYIVDEKTTSSLGASWSRQWEMRGQFTGYSWATKASLGLDASGTIIRGVSILKTKYDTQQAITYRLGWEIDRWLEQTLRDLARMQAMWEAGWWDYAMDNACGEYGGCSMLQVCKSQEPESWLPMYFEQRVWDPLLRKEMTVEEYEASWGHNG